MSQQLPRRPLPGATSCYWLLSTSSDLACWTAASLWLQQPTAKYPLRWVMPPSRRAPRALAHAIASDGAGWASIALQSCTRLSEDPTPQLGHLHLEAISCALLELEELSLPVSSLVVEQGRLLVIQKAQQWALGRQTGSRHTVWTMKTVALVSQWRRMRTSWLSMGSCLSPAFHRAILAIRCIRQQQSRKLDSRPRQPGQRHQLTVSIFSICKQLCSQKLIE